MTNGQIDTRRTNRRKNRAKLRPLSAGAILLAGFCFAAIDSQPGFSQKPPPASSAQKLPPPASAYAGDAACATCHQESLTYADTAHRQTSSWPTPKTVEGSFSKPTNLMRTANPILGFVMTEDANGFFQTAVDIEDPDHPRHVTERIDIVVGSGRKAQTYLYWMDDELFELPVSYWFPTKEWINSPGYPDGFVHFDKPIVPRCLDCHASYFVSLAPPLNRFRKGSLVLGITCEKCHGPGLKHVKLERSATPPERGATNLAIANPAHLSRERQMDMCALCHAGAATPKAVVGSFLPGDDINQYMTIHDPGPNAPVDVHADQVLLLRRSKCFQSSQMTCSTCHDVHKQQRDIAAFAGRCLSCHQIRQCGKFATMGKSIQTRCVDCHMPEQKSQVLFSDSGGRHIEPWVRTHRIAIYPDSEASR